MEKKNSRKKETIQLRYYELPEQEPVLTLLGPEWMRSYGTIPEDLHFHNLMEIGLCQWGEGTLCIDGQSYQYQDGAVTLIPANCLHTTLSRDQSVNQWEYLFLDPGQILNKSFPNDPWPKVVLNKAEAQTMPMLIANLSAGYSIDYGVLMMGVLFCSIPTMIVFFVLQKQFAEGITGAVK